MNYGKDDRTVHKLAPFVPGEFIAVVDFIMTAVAQGCAGAVVRFNTHSFSFISVSYLNPPGTTQNALFELADGL